MLQEAENLFRYRLEILKQVQHDGKVGVENHEIQRLNTKGIQNFGTIHFGKTRMGRNGIGESRRF